MNANRYFAGARRKVRAFAKKDKNAYKKIYFAARKEYRHKFDDIDDGGIRNVLSVAQRYANDKDPVVRAHSKGEADAMKAVLAERARKGKAIE